MLMTEAEIATATPLDTAAADKVMAEALGHPVEPLASPPRPTFAQLVGEYEAVDHAYRPLQKVRSAAVASALKIQKDGADLIKAAEKAFPLPAALVVPNTHPLITGGAVHYSDGKSTDFTPPPTIELRYTSSIAAWAKGDEALREEKERVWAAWRQDAREAGLDAVPGLRQAQEERTKAYVAIRPLLRPRDRLFKKIMAHRAADAGQLLTQMQIMARHTEGRVQRNGVVQVDTSAMEHAQAFDTMLSSASRFLVSQVRDAAPSSPATAGQLAAIPFEAVPEFTREQLTDDPTLSLQGTLPTLRLAAVMLGKTKPEMIEAALAMSADGEMDYFDDLVDGLEGAADHLRGWADRLAAARMRVIVGMAAAVEQPNPDPVLVPRPFAGPVVGTVSDGGQVTLTAEGEAMIANMQAAGPAALAKRYLENDRAQKAAAHDPDLERSLQEECEGLQRNMIRMPATTVADAMVLIALVFERYFRTYDIADIDQGSLEALDFAEAKVATNKALACLSRVGDVDPVDLGCAAIMVPHYVAEGGAV